MVTLTSFAGTSGAGGRSFFGDGGQEVLSQIDNTPQSGNNGVSLGSGGSGAISSGTGSGAAEVAQMGSSSYGNTHNQQGS
jgi:hypothetical protein